MRKIKFLIVGAGVTGLRFASHLSADEYLLLEKDVRMGGLCKSFYEKGFVWDYAGHFFHFKTEKMKNFFESKISKDEIISCVKETKIYYKGTLIDYPFQSNIHQLGKEEFIECLLDVYFRKEPKEYHDFREMLYGKFGKGITERFLQPYNEKLYACDLSSLDVDAMGRFFPYVDFDKIMQNIKGNQGSTYNDTFQYPKHGAQTFVDVLKDEVQEGNVLLETELIRVDMNEKIAVIKNEKIKYDFLINTIPLKKFAKLIIGSVVPPEMSGNKVLVFNLGFNSKTCLNNTHWIYFPDKEINFYRVGFYDNILNGSTGSLYVEIGFSEEKTIDIESELSKTIENLRKCNIINDSMELVCYNSLIIDLGYVHVSNVEAIDDYKNKLEKEGIYSIGRYGGWKYCSIEDCMIEADELAYRLGVNV